MTASRIPATGGAGLRVEDLKRTAQSARGTFGSACMTCAFREVSGQCGYFNLSQGFSRMRPELCGPEGRAWEPRPPRLGLIPWARRLLWGDSP
jgi:hypothetical protein